MKKILVVFLLVFFSKALGQTKSWVYTEGDVKIELQTSTNEAFLKQNEVNLIIIRFENVDSRTMSCSAPGLRILKGSTADKPESVWEVNLKDASQKDTYKIFFSYYKGKTRFNGKFEIPIQD